MLLVLPFLLFLVNCPGNAESVSSDSTADSSFHPGDTAGDTTSGVVLRFAGDCLLAGHYEDDAGDSVNLAFKDFDALEAADVAMVNLECPITTRGERVEKPYNFRMHPRYLKALLSAGIDVVNLANNHIYDYGDVGLFDTISYLDSVGIQHVGAGRNKIEAHAPVVKDIRGTRIAFLGYYGGGEAPKATKNQAGVADREIEGIRLDISNARKEKGADFVVVNLHWGTELADTPDVGQIYFAHRVIDAGANLIVGHHPHVLQGIERYKSGVIAYSLGNFLFGGNSRSTYDTALLEVRIRGDSVACDVIPIRVQRWHASRLKGVGALIVVHRIQDLSRNFSRSIFSHQEVR